MSETGPAQPRRGGQSLQEVNRTRRINVWKRRARLILGTIVVLAVAAGILTVYRFIRGNTYRIKVTDYVTAPVFAGLEGEGYMAEEPTLDAERLTEDIRQGLSYRKKEEELPDPAAAASYISLSVSPTESLSSGDTVTVTLDYDKDILRETYGFKFTGDSMEIAVDGLGEFQSLDPFAGVQLVFDGTAPNASVDVRYPDTNPTDGYNYQLTVNGEERRSGLDVGDTVTLRLTEDGQEAWHAAGLTPSRTEASYTMSAADVTRYVTGTGDFSPADLAALEKEAESLTEAATASWSFRPDIQADGSWLLIPKPDYTYDYAPFLVWSFRAEGQDSDGNPVTKYLSVTTSALWINAESTEGVLLAEETSPADEPAASAAENAESAQAEGDEGDLQTAEGTAPALAEKTDALPSKTEGAVQYSLRDFGGVNTYDDPESLKSSEITARVDKYQVIEWAE